LTEITLSGPQIFWSIFGSVI